MNNKTLKRQYLQDVEITNTPRITCIKLFLKAFAPLGIIILASLVSNFISSLIKWVRLYNIYGTDLVNYNESDSASEIIVSLVIKTFLSLLFIYIFTKKNFNTLKKDIKFKESLKNQNKFQYIKLGIALLFFIIFSCSYFGFIHSFTEYVNNTKYLASDIVKLILSATMIPIVEELSCRYVMYKTYTKINIRPTIAIILQAIFFSLMHMSIVSILPMLIFGIGLGFIINKSNSIWLTVIIHGIYNLSAGLLLMLFNMLPRIACAISMIAAIVLCIFVFLIYMKEGTLHEKKVKKFIQDIKNAI